MNQLDKQEIEELREWVQKCIREATTEAEEMGRKLDAVSSRRAREKVAAMRQAKASKGIKVVKMTWLKFYNVLAAVCLTFVLGLIGYSAVMTLRADGKPDYCYVEWYGSNQVELKAHVPWRSDFQITLCHSVDDAIATAAKMNCRLVK